LTKKACVFPIPQSVRADATLAGSLTHTGAPGLTHLVYHAAVFWVACMGRFELMGRDDKNLDLDR